MDIRLDGKRALVTGAGKGIGRAIAIKLSRCGADVVAISRTQDDLDSLKEEAPSIEIYAVDISDWSATRALIQNIGQIDLLVNNAGVVILTSFLDVTKEELDKQFDVNYNGVYNISQVVAKGMVDRGKGGSIVMVSSQSSIRAIDGHSVYCSSKAALDQLARCLALELGPHKIRVNCINPTITKTKLAMIDADWQNPAKAEPVLARIPLGKFAEIQNHTSYAFHAMWIANTIPARYDALKFSRVRLNDHDVYHQNTGEFTTPVDGTYMFSANVCVDRNKYLNLQFLADDTVIGAFRTGDQYQASCTSSTAMCQIRKGQIVKLVVARKWGSGGLVYNNEQGYLSSFSGMLIK